jgi:hypothetical protein
MPLLTEEADSPTSVLGEMNFDFANPTSLDHFLSNFEYRLDFEPEVVEDLSNVRALEEQFTVSGYKLMSLNLD